MFTIVVSFVIMLAILVLVHEFGHFIAAKKSGVLVEEFGFGLPPRIWGKKFGETLYSINLLPIGGFVKVYGEEYHEVEVKDEEAIPSNLKNRAFINKKPWQKILILTAGIIGNFLLGWVIISYLFTQGVPVPVSKVFVEKVTPNSPAEQAGLLAKDQLVQVIKDGVRYDLTSPTDLVELSSKYAGTSILIELKRDNEVKNVLITPRKNPPKNQGSLGVVISTPYEIKKYAWYQAPFYGLIEASRLTYTIAHELLKILYQFVTFRGVPTDVAGPVGIAVYSAEAAKRGLKEWFTLLSLLSLNLAVVNILPFPALDGGRLMFVLYETVTKRKMNQAIERNLNLAGISLLIFLAILISIHDVVKLIH